MWAFFREHPADSGVMIPPETGKFARHYELYQNYPNPFNPRTAIGFQLDAVSEVELSIYSVLGRKVHTLVSERKNPGHYKIIWDGKTSMGVEVPGGVYFYRLRAGDDFQSRKMVLLR